MAELGFKTVNEMIGRVDCLETDIVIDHWKRNGLDFSGILQPAEKIFENTEVYNTQGQDHGLEKALDNSLIAKCKNAIEKGEKVLVVEDVITTGGSVKEVINLVENAGGNILGIGVLVDRSNGTVKLHNNQYSIVKLDAASYGKDESLMN